MPGPSEPVLRPAERDRGADPPGALDTSSTTGGGHGRTAARRPAARREVGRLPSDRRCPGEVAFPGLAMIGTVEGRTERGGETSRERRYHLGPARLDAAALARAVRAHRGIENRRHGVLEVVFREDLSRLRTGRGPESVAVVRHMAVDLLRQARPTVSLENRRERAGRNTAHLEALVRRTA